MCLHTYIWLMDFIKQHLGPVQGITAKRGITANEDIQRGITAMGEA